MILTNAPEIKVIHHEVTFSDRQMDALNALQDDNVDELLYGGAKGGGKSVFGCQWVFLRAKQLINEFALKRQLNTKLIPIVGFMGRKQAVDFTATTLNTWKREIPELAYRIATIENSVKVIVIEETVAIQYGGLDDGDTVKKFNSAEFCFFFLDQAEECSEEDVAMLRGTLRLKLRDSRTNLYRSPKYKALYTANPKICWLKPAFITTPQPRTRYIRALPSDNPFLDAGYVERLKTAFAFKPELLKAYLQGSWDDLDAAFVCIPMRDVEKCIGSPLFATKETKKITVCDVSGMGDDETVIYDFVNAGVKQDAIEIYSHRSLMDTVGRLQAHAKKNGSNMICVDLVGEGSGVYSRLAEIFEADPTMTIYGFDGRVTPPGPDEIRKRNKSMPQRTYRNYKTYAWFSAAEKFAEKKVSLHDDQILHSQLASVTWHFTSNEVITLDSKDDLKAKLKHSPDRADCFIMGLDALDRAEPVRRIDVYKNNDPYSLSGSQRYRADAL